MAEVIACDLLQVVKKGRIQPSGLLGAA